MKYKVHILIFTLWAVAVSITASLLGGIMSLEAPLKGRWILTHVLQPETLDGARLLQHLLSRPALPNYDELVILPSPHEKIEKSLRAQGFKVSTQDWTAQIENSPQMSRPFYFLTSPKGESFFAGNYI